MTLKGFVNLAYILPPESEEKLQLAMRVNQMGMNNVFEAARLMGIQRVVYASTIAVYGLQDSFGDRPVTEDDHCYPVYSLHGAQAVGMSSWRRSTWSGTVWRFRGCVSPTWPRQGGQRASPPGRSRCIDELAAGRPFTIPSRRDQRLLILHVDDTAELFAKLCLQERLNYRGL